MYKCGVRRKLFNLNCMFVLILFGSYALLLLMYCVKVHGVYLVSSTQMGEYNLGFLMLFPLFRCVLKEVR